MISWSWPLRNAIEINSALSHMYDASFSPFVLLWRTRRITITVAINPIISSEPRFALLDESQMEPSRCNYKRWFIYRRFNRYVVTGWNFSHTSSMISYADESGYLTLASTCRRKRHSVDSALPQQYDEPTRRRPDDCLGTTMYNAMPCRVRYRTFSDYNYDEK